MPQPWSQWLTNSKLLYSATDQHALLACAPELTAVMGLEFYVLCMPYVRACHPEATSLTCIPEVLARLLNTEQVEFFRCETITP